MLAALAVAEVERINDKYSRYAPTSFLSAINRDAARGHSVKLDQETAALIDYAFACYQKSDGLFDITAGVLRQAWNFTAVALPEPQTVQRLLSLIGLDKVVWQPPHISFPVPGMEIDLGGIGKEYAVDRVAVLLQAEGVEHALIDLGGDFFALGPRADGNDWAIGIRDPQHSVATIGQVLLSRGALTTSGDYARCIRIGGRRYSHILNPKTGWPASGLSSVTALASQCMVAGSMSTIAMLKEREGISWLANTGQSHLWIDDEGKRGGNLAATLKDQLKI